MTVLNLQKKAGLLLASTHFASTGPGTMQDKQALFLAICGEKPVAQCLSAIQDKKRGAGYTKADDELSIRELLTNLGLAFNLRSESFGTWAVVSLEKPLINQFLVATDNHTLGKLLGYPDSAVKAYDTDDMLPMAEQDTLMKAAGLPLGMPQFCMSRSHATEELATLQRWYEILQKYGLGDKG